MAAKRKELEVGQRVGVPSGLDLLRGQIIEDRGRLGSGGKRLVRVEVASTSTEPTQFEIPADRLFREVTVHLEGIDHSQVDDFLTVLMRLAHENQFPIERAEFASEYESELGGAAVHIWLPQTTDPESAIGLITEAARRIDPGAGPKGMTFFTQ